MIATPEGPQGPFLYSGDQIPVGLLNKAEPDRNLIGNHIGGRVDMGATLRNSIQTPRG